MTLRTLNSQTAGRSALLSTMACVAVVFPLLGMMGFSLFTSFTILLLASPLSLLFSPVLVPAVILLAGAVVAFSFASFLALAGLSVFAWIYRSFKKKLPSTRSPSSGTPQIGVHDFGKGPSMVTGSGEKLPSTWPPFSETPQISAHDFRKGPRMVTETGEKPPSTRSPSSETPQIRVHDLAKGPGMVTESGEKLPSTRSPSSETTPEIKVHDFGKGPSMVSKSGEVKGPSATFVNGEMQTGKVKLGSF